MFSFLSIFLLFCFAAGGMESDTEASELDPADLDERDLWARLPKKFREQVGKSGGQLPRDEILGFLVDSEAEALELMAEFASDDGLAGRCLVEFGHVHFLERKGYASVEVGSTRLCNL